jgi:DNA-binding NtrC family response regulator
MPAFLLVVESGPDAGARLPIDATPRTVGRARDADLVLKDPCVSRRHLAVHREAEGVRASIVSSAAPFVVGDREATTALVLPDSRIVLGDTVLRVVVAADSGALPPVVSNTDVATLMTGRALDVRGLAGVFALVEALDRANDDDALMNAIDAWARVHAEATGISFADAETEEMPRDGLQTTLASDGTATVRVPAHTRRAAYVLFSLPPERLNDSLRRVLVVAGRVIASRRAQLDVVEAMGRDNATLRELAIGSARGFLGLSPAAQRLAQTLPRLAASDAVILLEGETGSGKSFVARLIHEGSARSREPFLVVNCAAIPESLIESELFGHERGAFTGAVATRQGAFESAGRGTLFLDELGELPLPSQAKLLRVLEDKQFERVGSNKSRRVQARIIAATNRDLSAMVSAGRFREDLFFRLSVISVRVPPLRERGEDIVLLARRILEDMRASAGRRVEGFTDEALDAIARYLWPGNVRELRNAVEHALVLGEGPWIQPQDLPGLVCSAAPPPQQEDADTVRLPMPLEDLEQRAIESALRLTGGNRTKAAALLGVTRMTLYNKLKLQ